MKTLKNGYTTGACAAAAAKAATKALVTQMTAINVGIVLPVDYKTNKTTVFKIESCRVEKESSTAGVIKDAGDDPDVTHGALISATAGIIKENQDGKSIRDNRGDNYFSNEQYDRLSAEGAPKVIIRGGKGVGVVTLPGLPVAVGEAAINPVPRKMIYRSIIEALEECGALDKIQGIEVTIEVENGEQIAQKTMNARLGILGGISILGTRGIVVPYSSAAYKSALVSAVKSAFNNNCRHIVFSTGSRTLAAAEKFYPQLPGQAFIEAGEYIGYSLKLCARFNIGKITLIAMIGKLTKVASGELMVHSKKSAIDFSFLSGLAEQAGAPPQLCHKIENANTASEVAGLMLRAGYNSFFYEIARLALDTCRGVFKRQAPLLETILVDADGEKLAVCPYENITNE